jgi:hypothetical protein
LSCVGVFLLDLDDGFLVGLSVRGNLPPVGESIGVAAFFASSGVRSTSSMLNVFSRLLLIASLKPRIAESAR